MLDELLHLTRIPLDPSHPHASGPPVYIAATPGGYLIVPETAFRAEFNRAYSTRNPALTRRDAYADWQLLSARGWANYNRCTQEQLAALKEIGEQVARVSYWQAEERASSALPIRE